MAFYGFKGDDDSCYWTPYYSTSYYNYESAPTPFPASDEFGESEYCYKDYSFTCPSELNYSVYTVSEPTTLHYDPQSYYPELSYSYPKFLQYEPLVSDRGSYVPAESNFIISYSVSQFNEPEFEEYDPTPYGGGYDLAVTYGKPLPPSDTICYPRTLPKSGGVLPENFSYNSIPSPYGKEKDDIPQKPPNGSKSIDTKLDKEAPVDGGGAAVGADVIPSDEDIVESSDDVIPGDDSHGYEYERRIDRIPYGSGLESLDLCESIFGNWPCLAKIERQQQQRGAKYLETCDQHGRMDPWESAANYLFGTPGIHGYGNYHQAHHQGYENSWL